MNKSNKFIQIFLSVLLFLSTVSILKPDDWEDLEEKTRTEVYGSEKSKKYSNSNIFFEIEKWENHYGVRILHLFDYTNYPKFNSTEFIPFYYRINSKVDNREKFRFLNYTFKKEKSKIDKSVFPFLFWGMNDKTEQIYNAALPIYFYSTTNNPNLEKTSLMIFPIPYYYSYQSQSTNTFSSKSHYSIFHGRVLNKSKETNQIQESSFWFPFLPLIRYTRLEDSYYHYLLPIYGYSRKENSAEEFTKFGFSLFPFYYSNFSYQIANKNKHFEITHWTLFHYRSLEEDKGEFHEYTHKSKWGFPVIPFLLYTASEQGVGYYKRVLTFFHWEKSENGELTGVSFLPFVFYEKEKYLRVPILFFDKDLSSATNSQGRTFFPLLLYYNRWDLKEQTLVIGPWVSISNEIKKEIFQTGFPLYWKFKSEKKDLTLFLPIYANYNDKENDYHFNLIWFTRSSTGIANPNISIGKKEENWYFDTDLTILYYLASVSFRKTLEKPKFLRNVLNRNKSYEEIEADKNSESKQVIVENEKPKDINPKLSRKKSVSREESLNFSGYSVLFGILSFEAADSRRHFRLLPLSWFSWDKNSKDKIYAAPFFLWYQTEAFEYFVAFPFYGKQKDPDSEKRVIFLNAFISENYKEENRKETSIFWPLVNWYSSDKKSGHRVLPFYIHQNIKSKIVETNWNYTLLSYYYNSKSNIATYTDFLFWPLLIYYKGSAQNDTNVQNNESNYWKESILWLTPFIYNSNSVNKNHTNLLWFIDFELNSSNDSTGKKSTKLKRLIVFPFYYSSSGYSGIFPISLNRKRNDYFWTFTMLNWIENSPENFYYNFMFLLEFEKSQNYFESNLLLNALHLQRSESESSFTSLWGYGWNFTKAKSNWQEASLLWYLGGGYRFSQYSTIYNLSFLFYKETSQDFSKTWILGNYTRHSKNGFRNNFLYLADYESFAADNSNTWDFLFTGIRYHNLKNENYFQGAYGYLWNFRKEKDIWSDASFLWLGYEFSKKETIYNFLPIIRTSDMNNESSRIYGPGLIYTTEENGKKSHLGLLGLAYWYSRDDANKIDETYILLGTLYREYRKKERGFRAKGSLWGWLWQYEKEEETNFEKFSILKIFSYTKEVDGTKKIFGISF